MVCRGPLEILRLYGARRSSMRFLMGALCAADGSRCSIAEGDLPSWNETKVGVSPLHDAGPHSAADSGAVRTIEASVL